MSDGRCETCKWWEGEYWDERGECRLAEFDYYVDGTKGPAHPESKALVEAVGRDMESASLMTTPDFGCVQHEPRDQGADS